MESFKLQYFTLRSFKYVDIWRATHFRFGLLKTKVFHDRHYHICIGHLRITI
ncbi:hypothetical protein LCGC14_1859650 [marine sediment metagenome]|uniref:Uncharacterized protein n=1 Tax=marine sediment metagenome TaxID=412755 RepID=A0A0F9IMC6_9ZZZZ